MPLDGAIFAAGEEVDSLHIVFLYSVQRPRALLNFRQLRGRAYTANNRTG